MTDTDIIVAGAGLSGLLAAVALATPEVGAGRRVTLIDAGEIARKGLDGRATALAPSSLRLLHRLGIAPGRAQPMVGMRVGEGRADSPWQFELPPRPDEPLAHVVENTALRAALLEALADLPVETIDSARIAALDTTRQMRVTLEDGRELTASLLVAADGRDSAVRRLSGISVSTHDFRQSALVTTVRHAEDHECLALQRFQPVGAVASLPLSDPHHSQIVWSDRTAAIGAAAKLDLGALAALIDDRLWGALDVTAVTEAVQTYPLLAQRAASLTGPRVALIGDAARLIHPLAGQGLNLGIRDIGALVETVREAAETGQDLGTTGLIGYERWRRADETLLGTLTAGLSAAPATRLGMVGRLSRAGRLLGHARRAAFAATDALPALHPFIRQEAAGETGTRPRLLA